MRTEIMRTTRTVGRSYEERWVGFIWMIPDVMQNCNRYEQTSASSLGGSYLSDWTSLDLTVKNPTGSGSFCAFESPLTKTHAKEFVLSHRQSVLHPSIQAI